MRVVAGLIGTAFLAGTAAAAPSLLPARVGQAIHDRIAAGEYPAVVVAVVDDGKSDVYGFGKLADGNAPDASTVFEIGSVTKTFTALLLAEAVKSGGVRLDEPVARLLPDFTIPARDGRQITLEELATQHSGLPRLPGNLKPADPADPYAGYGPEDLKAFLAHYRLTRDPGSQYEYSNLGFGLLGYALAHHAGESYGSLVQKKILAPLGMTASGATISAAMRPHLAPGHGGTGKTVENWSFDALAGAGAIKSTGADMLRYLEAEMGVMKTPLYPAMQLAQKPRADAPGKNEQVGLAWMTLTTPHGDVVWHNGMTGGYASFLGFTADGRRGVAILTNVQQSVDDLGFATLLADAPLAPAEKAISMNPQALQAYTGYYQLAPHFVLTVFRDGDQLYAQATGQGAAPIYPSAPDEFFAKLADIRISFQRDPGGRVTGLVLHQNGDHQAPAIGTAAAAAAIGEHIVPLTPVTLRDYVGRYRLAPGAVFDVTLKDGQLYAKLTGQGAYPIFPSARDRFFYLVVDAQIDFERDAQGNVTALVLHQNNADQRAPKIREAAASATGS